MANESSNIDYPSWLNDDLKPFWDADDLSCLRALIVGEAEGESDEGMFAVGCVVRTRVRMGGWWGNTYKEVCLKKHQFSCFWSDWLSRRKSCLDALDNPGKYKRADAAAKRALSAEDPDIVDGATHYVNPQHANPEWISSMVKVARIGNHVFYRE